MTLWQQVLRRKPVEAMTAETGTDTEGGGLKGTIGLFQLTLFQLAILRRIQWRQWLQCPCAQQSWWRFARRITRRRAAAMKTHEE